MKSLLKPLCRTRLKHLIQNCHPERSEGSAVRNERPTEGPIAQVQLQRIVVLLVLTCLIGLPDVHACVITSPQYKVASDFVVQVAFGRDPLKGTKVEISQFKNNGGEKRTIIASAVTNAEGAVAFIDIKPGEYFLTATHAGLESQDSGELAVVSDPHDPFSQAVVRLGWSASLFMATRRIAGNFTSYTFNEKEWSSRHETALHARVSLREFISSETLSESGTDEKGYFEFENLKPGFYILDVRSNEETRYPNWVPVGQILVHLCPDAKRKDLSAFLDMTDCGIVPRFVSGN